MKSNFQILLGIQILHNEFMQDFPSGIADSIDIDCLAYDLLRVTGNLNDHAIHYIFGKGTD